MRTASISLLVLLAACTNPAGLQGKDPTVLFNNVGQYSPIPNSQITFTWFDQSGQVQQTKIPWGTQTCIKFTATKLADSVRFELFAGDTTGTNGTFFKGSSPWFDPQTGIPNAGAGAYPNGAEYWWFDFTKNPFSGNPASSPC